MTRIPGQEANQPCQVQADATAEPLPDSATGDSTSSNLRLSWAPVPRSRKVTVSVYFDGQLLYRDVIDLNRDAERDRVANDIWEEYLRLTTVSEEQITTDAPGLCVAEIRCALLQMCGRVDGERAQEAVARIEAAANGGRPADHYANEDEDPNQCGLWRAGEPPHRLSNAVIRIERDVTVDDQQRPTRRFEGCIDLLGERAYFTLTADEYANNDKLRATLFAAAGPQLLFFTDMSQMRTAISNVSESQKTQVTTGMGWSAEGDVYRFPGGAVTATGFHEDQDGEDAVRVDLTGFEHAAQLGLKKPGRRITRLKLHLIEDFMQLQEPHVMRCLLASVALAVLYRFAQVPGKPAIWFRGLTGAGKSFLAQLALNFFGDFGVGLGRTMTWASTANAIQKTGYAYRDALYVVDDYKPEVCPSWDVTRILQSYADATARSRLNADSSAKVTWPIRGLLLSTGEDLPDLTPSAIARSIVVQVPQREKDLPLGQRCVEQAKHYPRITADFIGYLIRNDRLRGFPQQIRQLQEDFYRDIAGRQNDARIASNLAMLGAAFGEFCWYLQDVWPEAEQTADAFIQEDLAAICADMLQETHAQQASEVFCGTLWTLVDYGRVYVEGWSPRHGTTLDEIKAKPLVGRWVENHGGPGVGAFEISLSLSLSEVQQALRKEGKNELKVSHKALVQDLVRAGLVLDENGQPVSAEQRGPRTREARIAGRRTNTIWLVSPGLQGFAPRRREQESAAEQPAEEAAAGDRATEDPSAGDQES